MCIIEVDASQAKESQMTLKEVFEIKMAEAKNDSDIADALDRKLGYFSSDDQIVYADHYSKESLSHVLGLKVF